jgi:hypothetical protein
MISLNLGQQDVDREWDTIMNTTMFLHQSYGLCTCGRGTGDRDTDYRLLAEVDLGPVCNSSDGHGFTGSKASQKQN